MRTYINLSGLTVLAALVIWAFYWNAEQPYKIKNGFNRSLIDLYLSNPFVAQFPVVLKSMAIDGQNRLYIYGEDPTKIWRLNLMTRKIDTFHIPWGQPNAEKQFKLMANSEHLYALFQNQKQVLSYNLISATVKRHNLVNIPYRLLVTTSGNLIVNCTEANKQQPYLLKQRWNNTNIIARIKAWPNENSGIIPIDGEMHFDPVNSLISYHYFYKNGYMILDTNLNKIVTGKTIDTVIKGNVIVKKVGNAFTIASPPKFINGRACVNGGKLYINGHLKADNESTKGFRNHTVIDVYDILNGNYLYSFYVPVFKAKKANGFQVSEDNLICLYQNDVVVYKMRSVN